MGVWKVAAWSVLAALLGACAGIGPELAVSLIDDTKSRVDRVEALGDHIDRARAEGAQETLCERMRAREWLAMAPDKREAVQVFCGWPVGREASDGEGD